MATEDDLLESIASNVDDDTPRLVYADWLDEHDRHDRAEFIRVQIELARLTKYDPRRLVLHERQVELLNTHRREWLPKHWSFNSYPPETWRRGFVARVEKQGGRYKSEDGATLAAIPTLEELSLVQTAVNDNEFRLISTLPNLRQFWLWGSEELTDKSFALLSRCRTLGNLSLMCTGLTDASLVHLAELAELRTLAIEDGLEVELLSDAGLHHIAHLGDLEDLSLGSSGITGSGLSALNALPRLRRLALGLCRLTEDAIAPLIGCKRLEELDLNHYENEGIGNQLLAVLTRLQGLRILHAIRNDVTASGFHVLGQLTGLEELVVGGPNFGDNELSHLRALSQLRRLQLHANQFTAEGLSALGVLPNLRALNLSCHQQRAGAVAGIASLKRLRWLDMGHNLTDDEMEYCSQLPNLEVLRLRSPWVTNAGIARLKRIPHLRSLIAHQTRVTKAFAWDGRAEWAPHLESLDLGTFKGGPTDWLSERWRDY